MSNRQPPIARPVCITVSGRYFSFLLPSTSIASIEDVATSLSHTCRFGGHVRTFYSVAQHAYHVSECVPAGLALDALMSVAHKAFVGDMIWPLKQLDEEYQSIEERVREALLRQFRLSVAVSPAVREARRILLATELRDIGPVKSASEWPELIGVEPLMFKLQPMSSQVARKTFLDRYYELRARTNDANNFLAPGDEA